LHRILPTTARSTGPPSPPAFITGWRRGLYAQHCAAAPRLYILRFIYGFAGSSSHTGIPAYGFTRYYRLTEHPICTVGLRGIIRSCFSSGLFYTALRFQLYLPCHLTPHRRGTRLPSNTYLPHYPRIPLHRLLCRRAHARWLRTCRGRGRLNRGLHDRLVTWRLRDTARTCRYGCLSQLPCDRLACTLRAAPHVGVHTAPRQPLPPIDWVVAAHNMTPRFARAA